MSTVKAARIPMVVAIVAACLQVASPAQAIVPGLDGRLVMQGVRAGANRIFTEKPDGTEITEIGPGKQAVLSPDGRRYAFLTNENDLAVMDADGSNVRIVIPRTKYPASIDGLGMNHPAWSPDSNWIAFWQAASNVNPARMVRVADSVERLLSFSYAREPQFSPQGDRVVYYGRTAERPDNKPYVRVLDLQTRQETIVAQGEHPRWSPDGETLVFERVVAQGNLCLWIETMGYGRYIDYVKREIFTARADGTQVRQVTDTPLTPGKGCDAAHSPLTYPGWMSYYPLWSPDGAKILFRSNAGCCAAGFDYRTEYSTGIFTVKPDGSGWTRLPMKPALEPNAFEFVTDWESLPADLSVRILDGLPVDGHSNPLTRVKVELLQGGTVVNTPQVRTSYGVVHFPEVAPGDYRVRATLTDDNAAIWDVRYGTSDPLWVDAPVRVPAGHGVRTDLAFSSSQPGMQSNIPLPVDLDDSANIFWQLERFVGWSERTLKPSFGASTLRVHTFAFTDPGFPSEAVDPDAAFYRPSPPVMVLGATTSEFTTRQDIGDEAPENGEWHEFTHHLFATNISTGAGCSDNSVNHAGYRNPDTCDSFDEGFAMFLPVVASHDIDGVADNVYANFGIDLDVNAVAFAGKGNKEDFAVASLLWDLHDKGTESEQMTIRFGSEATGYVETDRMISDTSTAEIKPLWDLLATSKPQTIRELRAAGNPPDPTIDLNTDGVADIGVADGPYLLHGFYPVPVAEQRINETHLMPHYDLGSADLLGMSPANAAIGRTDHVDADGAGPGTELLPRLRTPTDDHANIRVQVRDQTGRPVTGAEVTLAFTSPRRAWTDTRRLRSADELVHLEPPAHNRYVSDTLPACNLGDDLVTITVSVRVNGATSAQNLQTDNCAFATAVEQATGEAAMTLEATVPQDAWAPGSSAQVSSLGQSSGGWSTTPWVVRFFCSDGGTGCRAPATYRIDGGPWVDALSPRLVIDQPGMHTLEFKAIDRVGNESPVGTQNLGVDPYPPLASMMNPEGSPVLGAAPVHLVAQASDDVSGLASVRFCVTGGACVDAQPLGVLDLWTAKSELASGTYQVSAVATDLANNLTRSAPVTVTVL